MQKHISREQNGTNLNSGEGGVEAKIEKVKDKLRKRARDEITPIPTIYNDVLVDIATARDESVAARLQTYPSIKSALYRARSSRLPSLPQSREDIHIEGRWKLTLSGEQFLVREEGDTEKIIIFATPANLRHLNWQLLKPSTSTEPLRCARDYSTRCLPSMPLYMDSSFL